MKKINAMTGKLITIGAIIILLLIGNFMILSKLNDRKKTRDVACSAISKSAGGPLSLSGICVKVPYEHEEEYYDDNNVKKRKTCYDEIVINPKKMNLDTEIFTEKRSVGIYSCPVFIGSLSIDADFEMETLEKTSNRIYHPERAKIILYLNEKSLQQHPTFTINGKEYETDVCLGLIYSSFKYVPGKYNFKTNLKIRGAESVDFITNASDTTLKAKCDWNAPGFTNYDYLPDERSITEEGFTATWSIPFSSSMIGFELVDSVDVYKKTERAVKYGFLFIIVPFITLFLFEMFASMQLHPVHYLLSGAASVVFFLLLLAFSEHISFGNAYLISGTASGVLVSLYVTSISGRAKIGLSMTGVFVALYAYLFCSLSSEDYALLIGSIFAFLVIAVLMFFTRKNNLGKIRENTIPEEKDIESSSC